KSGPADTALFAYFGQCVSLNKTGRQVGFLAKDSTIKNRSESAIACDLIQDRLKKLTSRQFAAFVDVRVNGYTPPVGEDEPNLAEVVRSLLGESDQGDPPPGRFVALAGNGSRPQLDLKEHSLFAHVLLAGLAGAADREGDEPDGLVTVDEIKQYLEREIPNLAAQHGKTRQEKNQAPIIASNPNTSFVLTRNPAAPQIKERLEQFEKLVTGQSISEARTAEGRRLLSRMPKLKSDRELRKLYQQLADGSLAVKDFESKRDKIIADRVVDRRAVTAFEKNVLRSAEV